MRRSRTRPALRASAALLASTALLALSAAVPATAAAKTHRLGTGTATFDLIPTETGVFLHAGVPPYPIFPSRMSWTTTSTTLHMPVSGGTWTTGTGAHGTFVLGGGLAFVDPDSTTPFDILDLTHWRIGIGTTGTISVSANGTRTPNFFDVKPPLSSIVTIHGHRFVKVIVGGLFFNATSVGAISVAIGSSPANPGDPFAVGVLLARLK